jgi:hypothetical protein
MRTNSLVAASSVVSCGVGALLAHILTKKYVSAQYELLIEEEVDKAKAFYSQLNKTDEFSDPVKLAEKLVTEPSVEESEVEDKEYVNYNKIAASYGGQQHIKRPTDIQKAMTRPLDGEDMADFEQRIMDEAKSEVQEVVLRTEETLLDSGEEEIVKRNIFDNHGRSDDYDLDRSNRSSEQPYILSQDEYMDAEPQYSQNSLTFYEKDGVLADNRDQPITDINMVVGLENLQFGKASGDMNIVYVRNDNLEVDFEILRSVGSYAEEVFGGSDRGRQNKGLN